MDDSELEEAINELYSLYEDIKREIKDRDSQFYERWKAGGFLIDSDIICMYPCLETFEVDRESTPTEVLAKLADGEDSDRAKRFTSNLPISGETADKLVKEN